MLAGNLLLIVALAGHIPGAAAWLPLAPLFLFVPSVLQQLLSTWPRRTLWQIIPDPLAPKWHEVTAAMAAAIRLQEGNTTELQIRCAPLFYLDGTPLAYQLDFRPEQKRLNLTLEGDKRPRVSTALQPMPRLQLPLPAVVGTQALLLRLKWPKTDRKPQEVVVQRADWSARYKRLRLPGLMRCWIGAVALLRLTLPESGWCRSLQDPVGFLMWAWLAPVIANELRARVVTWRYQRKDRV